MYKTYSYILSENVSGYGKGNRKPSGYCKIRCLDDKNMVDVNIRNIDTDRNKYNCYLIYFKDKYYGVNIGEATVLGENSITLKKDIQARGKMNNCDLKGFAITCELEDNKAILYGYNDESDLWDGHFMKDEELEEEKVHEKEDIKEDIKEGIKEEMEYEMKEEPKEEMKEEKEYETEEEPKEEMKEEIEYETEQEPKAEMKKEIKYETEEEPKEEMKEEMEYETEEKMQESTHDKNMDEAVETIDISKIPFNENLYKKINIDDLIHMDRFSWAIFNNIFLYISYKKYGFVFYKQDLQKCILAIPVEEKYIKNVKDRHQYIEAYGKEYEGYIMLKW